MKIHKNGDHVVGCTLKYKPFNRHAHFRFDFGPGGVSRIVMNDMLPQYGGALVMPNTFGNLILTSTKATQYKRDLEYLVPFGKEFQPKMTCYLNEHTNVDNLILGFVDHVWVAGKCYFTFAGAGTTGSEHGISDIEKMSPIFEAMEKIGMPVLIHGEIHDPSTDIFDRERIFIETVLAKIFEKFPGLRIVLEHITTAEAVELVESKGGQVRATITPHHLKFNRNALFDGGYPPYKLGMRPHYWCLPVLKEERHRKALLRAIASGSPWFGAGDDTAPHVVGTKECSCGCAGCYVSPNSVELYWESFLEAGAVKHFENFMCVNGLGMYGMEPIPGKMEITKEQWTVPEKRGDIVPLCAGWSMEWRARIVEDTES